MPKFDHILERELTRKEFLVTLGVAFMSLFGIAALFGALGDNRNANKSDSYGGSAYGGDRKSLN